MALSPIDNIHRSLPSIRKEEATPVYLQEKGADSHSLSPSPSLLGRISQIPKSVLAIGKDSQWMGLFGEATGVASQACESAGGEALKAVPFLSLATAPLYLFQAFKNAYKRLRYVVISVKAHNIAMTGFNLGNTLDAIGSALGSIAKPLAGGFNVIGLGKLVVSGLFFTLILPITLIVTGAVGGVMKGCSLGRNAKMLSQFNARAENKEHPLKAIFETISYLQGFDTEKRNSEAVSDLVEAQLKLEKNAFKSQFTNKKRREAIVLKSKEFFKGIDLSAVATLQKYISTHQPSLEPQLKEPPKEMESLRQVFTEVNALLLSIASSEKQPFDVMDEVIHLCEKVEELSSNNLWEENSEMKELLQQIKNQQESLVSLKTTLLKEGGDIISLVRSEMHRAILSNSVSLLVACLVFIAGVLSMISTHYQNITLILSFSSSGVTIGYILFDKAVSQEKFHRMHVFFHH